MATKNIGLKDTAKLVRQALKDNFKKDYPSVKFSVRCERYSTGCSIYVRYSSPLLHESEVRRVTRQFEGAGFDGMTDSKYYKNTIFNGEEVNFGADYVVVQNRSY